jgi:hypothetical protein
MSNVNITPQTVLLTSGQAVTFEATNATGQTVAVSWRLEPTAPASGTLVTPASGGAGVATQSPSATYVAPQPLSGARTIAVIASTATDSASATIFLTPIAIVPARAQLQTDQSQQFIPVVDPVPGATPTGGIKWILSPPIGSLDETGLYRAPHEVSESTTVNVIATTDRPGERAVATVTLSSTPWHGPGANALGAYLLSVFSLVILLVLLWPPALPSPDTAKADRILAEQTLDAKTKTLEEAEVAAAAATVAEPKAGTSGTKADGGATTPETAGAKVQVADQVRQRAKDARDGASRDLESKQAIEATVNNPYVNTKLDAHINRELDLLWLVLLAGSLGSFLHTAQSYSDYVGNRTLKISWTWWYAFRPFIGAGLALVFYAAVRGGFMAIATGSNAKASELNPFGVVSIAAMVGMFSKAATMKLGDVFDTLFKSDKAKESKDKLAGPSQTSSPAAGQPTGGNAGASTPAK